MNKKKKILIFGAGAIGRGFLAPKFYLKNYAISFVDSNEELIKKLSKRKKYICTPLTYQISFYDNFYIYYIMYIHLYKGHAIRITCQL